MREDKKIYKLNKNDQVRNLKKDDKIYVDDANDEIKIIKQNKATKKSVENNKEKETLVDNDFDEQEIENLDIVDDNGLNVSDKTENLNEMETIVKDIVFAEFSRLIDTIEDDFIVNYNKKRYNFLLSQLDELVTATMVFVSSFESKSGFAIERVAERVARVRYGEENVPYIINPRGLEHNIQAEVVNGQIIVTDIDLDHGTLKGEIAKFRASNVASGRGKNRKESGVTQESIKELIPIGQEYKIDEIKIKPVDLAFYDGENWNILELKAGGDLDSSNAPSNIEKLLSIYTGVNVENAKVYFATLYNKDGEGNTWTGAVKKHMAYPEMFLIGKDLWNKILPKGIVYERFTELYKIALEEIDLNERIKSMIRSALE
ncbi:hypothetical protein [Sneathia sanguinegens]|uniref:hypothetical protein n=1 Tax=Sneathia sanguinegens TaxID=40543 RepID=UPI0018DB6B8A|nr:hypothetical protein [Sneathia sanguinegens]